jgi:hypothetical protein
LPSTWNDAFLAIFLSLTPTILDGIHGRDEEDVTLLEAELIFVLGRIRE